MRKEGEFYEVGEDALCDPSDRGLGSLGRL